MTVTADEFSHRCLYLRMRMKNVIRQGDLVLHKYRWLSLGRSGLDEITPPPGKIVLACDDATGHASVILDRGTTVQPTVRLWAGGPGDILEVTKAVTLHHEEYGTAVLPRGVYVLSYSYCAADCSWCGGARDFRTCQNGTEWRLGRRPIPRHKLTPPVSTRPLFLSIHRQTD